MSKEQVGGAFVLRVFEWSSNGKVRHGLFNPSSFISKRTAIPWDHEPIQRRAFINRLDAETRDIQQQRFYSSLNGEANPTLPIMVIF